LAAGAFCLGFTNSLFPYKYFASGNLQTGLNGVYRAMSKIMIGCKVDPEFKEFLEKLADGENRSLSNFIINALLTYSKDHKGLDWKKRKGVKNLLDKHEEEISKK
jgi:hypothetical protein